MLHTNHANALQSFDVHNATSCDASKALRSCDASLRSPRSHLLLSDCGSGCHRLLSNPDPTTMQSTSPLLTPFLPPLHSSLWDSSLFLVSWDRVRAAQLSALSTKPADPQRLPISVNFCDKNTTFAYYGQICQIWYFGAPKIVEIWMSLKRSCKMQFRCVGKY